MKDADFLADSKKITQAVEPMTGAAVAALLQKAYATPQAVIDRYVGLTRPDAK